MNSSGNIYSRMKEDEIIELINFAPTNLKDLFDKAVEF